MADVKFVLRVHKTDDGIVTAVIVVKQASGDFVAGEAYVRWNADAGQLIAINEIRRSDLVIYARQIEDGRAGVLFGTPLGGDPIEAARTRVVVLVFDADDLAALGLEWDVDHFPDNKIVDRHSVPRRPDKFSVKLATE